MTGTAGSQTTGNVQGTTGTTTGTATGTTGTTTGTGATSLQNETAEGIDVDVDTGAGAEGAVDVDVNDTADADTDASGIDETGTDTGTYLDTDTGALPDTDGPDTRMTCGEVRDINRAHYVLSLGRRFGTRHYVVTPSTIFSPSDYSYEMVGVGSRVMISYVTVHGIRIAVHITVHE